MVPSNVLTDKRRYAGPVTAGQVWCDGKSESWKRFLLGEVT